MWKFMGWELREMAPAPAARGAEEEIFVQFLTHKYRLLSMTEYKNSSYSQRPVPTSRAEVLTAIVVARIGGSRCPQPSLPSLPASVAICVRPLHSHSPSLTSRLPRLPSQRSANAVAVPLSSVRCPSVVCVKCLFA